MYITILRYSLLIYSIRGVKQATCVSTYSDIIHRNPCCLQLESGLPLLEGVEFVQSRDWPQRTARPDTGVWDIKNLAVQWVFCNSTVHTYARCSIVFSTSPLWVKSWQDYKDVDKDVEQLHKDENRFHHLDTYHDLVMTWKFSFAIQSSVKAHFKTNKWDSGSTTQCWKRKQGTMKTRRYQHIRNITRTQWRYELG